nr:3-isopropylmalate dehydrogenase, chloroplastic-like [Tanacetum cinerariifolium]
MALHIAKRLMRNRTTNEFITNSIRNPTVGLYSSSDRNYSSSSSGLIRATLFPGDGIGPEIAESVKQ